MWPIQSLLKLKVAINQNKSKLIASCQLLNKITSETPFQHRILFCQKKKKKERKKIFRILHSIERDNIPGYKIKNDKKQNNNKHNKK